MERVKKSKRYLIRDVPEELIQHIQSLLPVNEAARTCVLSKSWLRAWSTIPTLRFRHQSKLTEKQYIKLINRTLRRYHRDNIPIVTFDLHFDVHNKKAFSLTDKWLRKVVSKSCLKELYLELSVDDKSSYTLTNEIFSSKNLNTIIVKLDWRYMINRCGFRTGPLHISNNKDVVINCVNLRVIELLELRISEEVLHKLFSTCTLLEKISLSFCNKYKTLKVKSLRHLRELRITPYSGRGILEIYDLPNLHLFSFDSSMIVTGKRLWFNKDSLGSLRILFLGGVVIDNAFCDIFKSNFPLLEILSLNIDDCKHKILDITCASLQRLIIELLEKEQVYIQVSAPRLCYFSYTGEAIPRLSFPVVVPDQIELTLQLMDPVYVSNPSFFLEIREILNLSSNFKIKIKSYLSCLIVPFNIDGVRIWDISPATNVQKLSFDTLYLINHSPLVDAFFLICHPKYLEALNLTSYFQNLIGRRVVEKETRMNYWPDLEYVEVANCVEEKCGTLTRSWSSLLDGLTLDQYFILARLTWRSPKSVEAAHLWFYYLIY